MSPTIIVCADLNALTRRAEAIVRQSAADAQAAGRRWSVALAGGSTPRGLYRRLAEPTTTVDTAPPSTIDWTRAEIFFGDERTVPPDHADSNYGMVRDALLSRAPIPAANVHRMQGEASDLDAAARGYKDINLRALRLLGPGGILVSCSCSHHVSEAMLLEIVAEAALDSGRELRVIERRTQTQDHPILLTVPETHYLKCIILQVL